jgi:hypothetical protein
MLTEPPKTRGIHEQAKTTMQKNQPAPPSAEVRVTLDIERLKLLRQRGPDSHAALSGRFVERRRCFTNAALKRAAAGRPVRFRTVRHLATFYGIGVEALIAPAAAPATAAFGVERLQCAALFDAVLASGYGRLAEVRGAPGSEKALMLAECIEDARRRGFAGVALGLGGPDATGALARLVRALLYIGALDGGDDELVASRCRALGLGAAHVAACIEILSGLDPWPLPAVQMRHAAALCALIRQRARRQPLVLAIDELQCADWLFSVMLDTVLPATLDLPLVWLLAFEEQPGAAARPLGARLERLPRSSFHLPGVPGARPTPCAASVLRLGRTARGN